jgi:hypothetical protein
MFNESGVIRRIQLAGLHRRDASQQELQRARYFSTLTVCFRNVLKELPVELRGVRMEDICWWSLLGSRKFALRLTVSIRKVFYRCNLKSNVQQ